MRVTKDPKSFRIKRLGILIPSRRFLRDSGDRITNRLLAPLLISRKTRIPQWVVFTRGVYFFFRMPDVRALGTVSEMMMVGFSQNFFESLLLVYMMKMKTE